MSKREIPKFTRPLFNAEPEVVPIPETKQEIGDRKLEAQRVVKRLTTILDEHRSASRQLDVKIDASQLGIVIAALRDHARGGAGKLVLDGCDEIVSHCLNRLFEELVEEPSNILFTTATGPDTMRYDAMDPTFWIECLDLLEENAKSNEAK